MLLLAIDTSGKNGSLALVRVNPTQTEERLEVLELVPLTGRMYSAQLIPELQAALARQRLKKSDIDAYAVASGPGSFTGLRVGLSTVKALSEVQGKPIAAVSVLEAAARMAGYNDVVTIVLDAGRKQAFMGEYEFDANFKPIRAEESLVSLDSTSPKGGEMWSANISSFPKDRVFSPDPMVRELAAAQGMMVHEIPAPQADMFARIGYEKILRGETTPAETLEANYIRASDAELFSLPKLL